MKLRIKPPNRSAFDEKYIKIFFRFLKELDLFKETMVIYKGAIREKKYKMTGVKQLLSFSRPHMYLRGRDIFPKQWNNTGIPELGKWASIALLWDYTLMTNNYIDYDFYHDNGSSTAEMIRHHIESLLTSLDSYKALPDKKIVDELTRVLKELDVIIEREKMSYLFMKDDPFSSEKRIKFTRFG